jgi:23S rRNA pseudoU1915 N3-methylase RlmH
MDKELEENIDDLIKKATKDLKNRICRVVLKHQAKVIKNQKIITKKSDNIQKSKKEVVAKYYSDSDGYYSG